MRRVWLFGPAAAALVSSAVFELGNAPGHVSVSHERANVSCSDCHGGPTNEFGPGRESSSRCVACHGDHVSSRPAHRALQKRAALTCATCHAGHRSHVAIAGDSNRVALVGRESCETCHSLDKASDPAARCFDPLKRDRASVCFDEHGNARANLWGKIESSQLRVAPSSRIAEWRGAFPPIAAVFSAMLLFLLKRTRVAKRATGQDVPRKTPARAAFAKALPVIDQTSCLGCNACVEACAFDVLEVRSFVAHVARPEACCGAVTCAEVCPNGSLIVSERGDAGDTLALTEEGESIYVPGIFVAGDLSGLPLIKNAVAQGSRAVERIAARALNEARGESSVDLAIVGAGPAGLSAALRAKELGLSCVVYEQATVASTIREFPREKLVFEQPLMVPKEGPLWFRECTKEELIREWTRIVRQERLAIRERERVLGILNVPGGFLVTSQTADSAVCEVRSRHVLLAIGRRGSPRRLDVDIDAEVEHLVSYTLADAVTYAGKRVLVVGLGDSALEAIQALARQPGTSVVVSYRGRGFEKGSAKNIDAVRALVERRQVRIVFESELARVEEGRVVLSSAAGDQTIECDAVFALLGGVAPRGWLAEIGVWPPKKRVESEKL